MIPPHIGKTGCGANPPHFAQELTVLASSLLSFLQRKSWGRWIAAWILLGLVQGASFTNSKVCKADELVRRSGKHIRLTTDVTDESKIAELIAAFDAAVPQWAAIWQVPVGSLNDWVVDAHLIRDKERFYAQRLIPRSVPDFPFGYALNDQVWVMNQKSDYYTRHLLLHEGVHALAFRLFGGTGPSWFMEGTAEMMGVHTGSGKDTRVNQIPINRESVPYWGRFKLMSARRDAKAIPSLETVMGYPRDLRSDVESYGWSWAATMLLYNYPEYRNAFIDVAKRGRDRDAEFNSSLTNSLKGQWPILTARWRLMCNDLDYGFDWSHEQVKLSLADRVWDKSPLSIKIDAKSGWQSIGVRLERGMKLNVVPSGRCTLANQPKPWISEPPGVTIRYHRGRPLGQLIACLVPNAPDNASTLEPLRIAPITKPVQIPINENCWLLFRINDVLGELGDNQGSYQIKIADGKTNS